MSHLLTSNLWHNWRKEDQEKGKKHEIEKKIKDIYICVEGITIFTDIQNKDHVSYLQNFSAIKYIYN
jgi:hypothetical protein